jgi:cytochrome c oxidase subunit 2
MSLSKWGRQFAKLAVVVGILSMSMAAAAEVPHDWSMNLMYGVTPIAHKIWDLHMGALWTVFGLGVIVFGTLIIAFIRFRHSKGAVAATWKHNGKVEFVWTLVPVLILLGLAIPATMLTREMYNTSNSQMTVKVTGYQWLWQYNYVSYEGKSIAKVPPIWSRLAWNSNRARQLDSGISPYSVIDKKTGQNVYLLNVTHPLVIPAHVKVRFLITGGDVIHGFGVPDFGIKKAAIPGIVNSAWATVEKPGVYRGQCYVLCGQDHSAMPIVVKVLPKAQFNKWLAEQENAGALEKAERTAKVPTVQPAPPKG